MFFPGHLPLSINWHGGLLLSDGPQPPQGLQEHPPAGADPSGGNVQEQKGQAEGNMRINFLSISWWRSVADCQDVRGSHLHLYGVLGPLSYLLHTGLSSSLHNKIPAHRLEADSIHSLNILFNLNFSRTCLPFLFLARHVKLLCQSDNLLLDECKVGREERKREVTEIKYPPLISFRFRGYFNQLFCCIPRFFKNRISISSKVILFYFFVQFHGLNYKEALGKTQR